MSVLAETAGDLSHVTLLRLDGRDAAIAISFVLDGTFYQRQLGFDYEVTGRAFEYFFLAFYSPLEYAISRGLSRVDLGIGSYRAKLLRGARVEALGGYARSRGGRSPVEHGPFRSWNQERAAIIARADVDELEGVPGL
jgi:predicted N-acyltransferase